MSDEPDNEQLFYAKKRRMRRSMKERLEEQTPYEHKKPRLTPTPKVKHKKKLFEVNDYDDES